MEGMQEIADIFWELSLVTDIVQYHISVHQLRSPRKGNDNTAFTSIEFSI